MKVYLDHAATTYVDKEVLQEMMPYFTETFGNANSQHGFGRDAAIAVDKARNQIAKALNAKTNEIYFTSGGTEADNWALKGIASANMDKGNHIITTKIEHAAIHESAKYLEKHGFKVDYLSVDSDGVVDLNELESLITDKTILVSVMTANNEIGTIQPIKQIGEICKNHKVLFHTDAVQAAGAINLDVKDLGVDLMSISGHKFYGPKGIGVLYVRTGVKIDNLLSGGHQERTKRGGTSNVPAIVGMGKALELATTNLEEKSKKIADMRDYFVSEVMKKIPYVTYNGSKTNRLPNNASLSFEFLEGESILFSLDLEGIASSSGSACSSGSLEPSATLLAIGKAPKDAHGTLRFSFGKDNDYKQIDYTVEKLVEIVERLRNMSPLFYEFKKENKNV